MTDPWRKRVEIGPHVLYLGDCIEIMAHLALQGDVRADASLTDPPYASGGFTEAAKTKAAGQGLRNETLRGHSSRLKSRPSDESGVWFAGDAMTGAGAAFLMREAGRLIFDLTTEQATLSMFTDWRVLSAFSDAVESGRWRYQNLIVWNKKSAGLGSGFRAQHELMMHFSKGAPPYYSAMHGNVLTAERVKPQHRDHACEKPLKLLRNIIETVAPEGGLLIDPFMGAGSTGIACTMRNVRFIGIEIDENYFDIACRRIKHANYGAPITDSQSKPYAGKQGDLLDL